MKVRTTIKGCCAVLIIATAVGCSKHSGGGGGGSPAPKQSDNGAPSPTDASVLSIDMNALAATDNSLQTESGTGTLWTVRVTDNGQEKANLTAAAFADVNDALKGLTFKRGDVARFEMTIVDKANAKLILATNLESVATADPSLKSVWDTQCQGVVNADVTFTDDGLWTFDGKTGTSSIKLSICDFAGVTLKPMLEITPQAQTLSKKTVIYHCKISAPSTGTNDLWMYQNVPCSYGYQTVVGETAPTISVLKDYAPDSPLYATHLLVLDRFELDLGPSGQPLLTTNFAAPPFGSLDACETQKLDVKYGGDSGIKTARLTFKRTTDQSGNVVWIPDSQTGWPTLGQLVSYYGTASVEAIDLYRICEWIPEVEDSAAGNVIQFNGQ